MLRIYKPLGLEYERSPRNSAKDIHGFGGDHRWLSNFFEVTPPFVLYGLKWSSSEQAYMWNKSDDPAYKLGIRKAQTPKACKALGYKAVLHPDWETRKYRVMYEVVKAKFHENFELADRLKPTGGVYLEETNYWGDRIWGVCRGEGKNHLGRILMLVRHELQTLERP